MRTLVTGATGSIGREVLRQLMDAGVDVVASTRDPSGSSLPTGVEVRAIDLAEPRTLAAGLDGVEAMYLFPSFEDPHGVAAAIAEAGVARVVLLSSISTSLPDAASQFNASRFLDLEDAIESTGVSWTFLRAGEFAGNLRFYAPGLDRGSVRVPLPDSLHLPLDERDIAEVAVIALTSDALAGGRPRLTGAEVLSLRAEIEAVGAAIGHRIEVHEMPLEEARDRFAPAAPRRLISTMLQIWQDSLTHRPEPSGEIERITGHEPRSFAAWARDNAPSLR